MSRSRTWREKSAVYLVALPSNFVPSSPWGWPDDFSDAKVYVKNLSVQEARVAAATFNKRSMQRREADVAGWDRQWAIACCSCRHKGRDRFEDAAERPQLRPLMIGGAA